MEDLRSFESCITSITDNIEIKYKEAKNTKVEDYVSNDTKERIENKMKGIDEDIKFLEDFTGIFFPPDKIPSNVLKDIQENNLKNYNEFLRQTEEEVSNAFTV